MKKQFLSMFTVCCIAATSFVPMVPLSDVYAVDTANIPSAETITWDDAKAIEAFLLSADYDGTGKVLDIDRDGRVDVFDLCLAREMLIKPTLPTLSDFKADIFDIHINSEESVTFTLEVKSPAALEKGEISVYDDNKNSIAVMHDDGKNGDKKANDGIYTAVAVLSSKEMKTVNYYAATNMVKSNSCDILFYRDLEEEELKNFWILFSKISFMTFDEACRFIEKSDEITDYSINKDNNLITYHSVYGIDGCWEEVNDFSVNPDDKDTELNLIDYSDFEYITNSSGFSAQHPDKKDVAVLRPFTYGFKYNDFETVGRMAADVLDSNVEIFDDEKVSIEQMKNLDSYGTILVESYGASKNCEMPYIVSGEVLDETDFISEGDSSAQQIANSADFLSGRICCTSVRSGNKVFNRMAVGGDFFTKYYADNSLSDSFWFLGTSYSLSDDTLADVLIEKGAEAVVGYTNSVSEEYCCKTLSETVLNNMISSCDTVSESVDKTIEVCGKNDTTAKAAEIEMRGNKDFKLVNKTHRIYFPELVNEYTGTYVEDQGLTSLDFSIISCDKNGQIEALFYYYPNPENPDVETGRYKMVGEVKDYSDGIVTVGFVGTEWVEKSQTYHILDFTAKIDIAQNTLTSDEYELKLIGSPYRYQHIISTYSGSYVASQGLTALDFSILSCDQNGKIDALFSFDKHPKNSKPEKGSYKMVGEITDFSDGIITAEFMGTDWVEKPETYHILDFTAKIDIVNDTLTSNDHEIDLVRSSDFYYQNLLKTYTGSYVAGQGKTALDFTILSCDKQGRFDTLFSYDKHPDNSKPERGSYRMVGQIRDFTDNVITVDFVGTEWVNRSSDYVILDFTAKIDVVQNTFSSDDYELNIVSSSDFKLDVAGDYSGTYKLSSGLMGLDFNITSCNNIGDVTALFKFYPHSTNSSKNLSGSYTMNGKVIDISENGEVSIEFVGDEWIEKPEKFNFLEFEALISKDKSQLTSDTKNMELFLK